MAFNQPRDPASAVQELRNQGFTDRMIIDELTKQGYTLGQVNAAIHDESDSGETMSMSSGHGMPPAPSFSPQQSQPQMERGENSNIYERIEEIAESIIDEKWDELLVEVRKIVDWKEKVEAKQMKMMLDLTKLKEDFMLLHQGVLGKLESYDERMQEVGTELQAVGKVFKDVVPEFVENVKELSRLKEGMKRR